MVVLVIVVVGVRVVVHIIVVVARGRIVVVSVVVDVGGARSAAARGKDMSDRVGSHGHAVVLRAELGDLVLVVDHPMFVPHNRLLQLLVLKKRLEVLGAQGLDLAGCVTVARTGVRRA